MSHPPLCLHRCDHMENVVQHVVQQVLHNIHVLTIYSGLEFSSILAEDRLDEGESLFDRVIVQ